MIESPLHQSHLDLGARMAPFAGWSMPIQYTGIVAEHQAVRETAGIFDISHMGEFEVSGSGVADWLNRLLTNDVTLLDIGEGQYTILLNQEGGVIDDLILYRVGEERFFLVVNASKSEEDAGWLKKHLDEGIVFQDRSSEFGAVALQGPNSAKIWDLCNAGTELPARNGIVELEGENVLICRTGYTGEDGFEFFAPVSEISDWWKKFNAHGAIPCGLGARDTLRLEKCFPLNGTDLDPDHTPLEAGLGFFVKLDKAEGFIGCERLREQKEAGLERRLAAIEVVGKAPPPRHGYEVRDEEGEKLLAELTSGSLSPSLKKGIGMAYLPLSYCEPETPVSIAVRDRVFPAKVVKKPFI